MSLLLDFQFYFIDLHIYLMPVPHYLNYCCFVISFEIKKGESSDHVHLFSDDFSYPWSPEFTCDFLGYSYQYPQRNNIGFL